MRPYTRFDCVHFNYTSGAVQMHFNYTSGAVQMHFNYTSDTLQVHNGDIVLRETL